MAKFFFTNKVNGDDLSVVGDRIMEAESDPIPGVDGGAFIIFDVDDTIHAILPCKSWETQDIMEVTDSE